MIGAIDDLNFPKKDGVYPVGTEVDRRALTANLQPYCGIPHYPRRYRLLA